MHIEPAQIRRSALTLVEVVAAMAVMSIITVAVAGTLMIAARAVDDGKSPDSQTPQAREIADEIVADLGDALEFNERTDTSVAFTVPDRDADGLPETIRYAWDADSNGVLTREYNGGSAVTLAEDVHGFNLTYLVRTVTPPPQACCWLNGTCSDEIPDDCTSNGGLPKGRKTTCENVLCVGACCVNGGCVDATESVCLMKGGEYQGDGTACADIRCNSAIEMLFVVASIDNMTKQEEAIQELLESFGFAVQLITDGTSQGDYDTAAADADVAYISPSVEGHVLGTKLTNARIGVVSANVSVLDELGLSSDPSSSVDTREAEIVNNAHYITSRFAVGAVTISESTQRFEEVVSGVADGAEILATVSDNGDALFAVELGATLAGGAPAPGRRVQLPFGNTNLDVGELTDDAKTIVRRAIEWASDDVKQILDRFTSIAYDGSDGTEPWSDDWREIGESNGVYADYVSVAGSSDCANGNCLNFGSNDNRSVDGYGAYREADISGATWATLSFDYKRIETANSVDVILSISGDGGDNWTDLATYTLDATESIQTTERFDITSYISDQTRVRILGSGTELIRGYIFIDNVQILFGGTAGSGVGGGGDTICGDGTCEAGEDSCNCSADCGEPADYEQPGVDCDDGLDNDCDGQTDCDDINCPSDPSCVECGDLVCEGGETSCNCPADCGAAPATETGDVVCADGEDNDCDGKVDCGDPDCTSSAPCAGSCICSGTYADDFESRDFGGSTGDIDWPGDWIEVGESDGPVDGDILIKDDIGSLALRLRDNNNGGEGAARDVPLCATGTATLSFIYRRSNLVSTNDYAMIQISANGSGGPWTELARFVGPAEDSGYQTFVHDISAHAGPDTQIRFITSPDNGNTAKVWIDDLTVTCSP